MASVNEILYQKTFVMCKTSPSQAQLIKSSPGGLKVVIESLETNSENAIIMIVIHLMYVNKSFIVLQGICPDKD